MSRATALVPTQLRRVLSVAAVGAVVLTGCGEGDADDVVSSAEEVASDVADGVDENAEDVEAASGTVVAALQDAGLSTLASAVSQVDFAEVAGTDEFTFFAPNDDAFLALTADELADLTADVDLLTTTLQAHVVDTPVPSAELVEMTEVATVAGTTLPVTVDGDTVMVGDGTVVTPDVEVGDGVVHVIDTLLSAE